MNLHELRINAQLHVDQQIDPSFAEIYANEGVAHLTNLHFKNALKKVKKTIEIKRKEAYFLPEDCFLVLRLWYRDIPYKHFEVYTTQDGGWKYDGSSWSFVQEEGEVIECEDGGSFVMKFLKNPTPLREETDVPDIRSPFFPSIALFIAARESFRLKGKNSQEGMRLLQEFGESAEIANNMITRSASKKIIRPREWR